MKTEQLLSDAVNNLPDGFSLSYELSGQGGNIDGQALLVGPHQEKICFALEIKHIHRQEALWRIKKPSNDLPLLLVCNRLTPALFAHCAANGINFIDTAGNARIQAPGFFLSIEGKQGEKTITARGGFPEGVMKLLFVLLSTPETLNYPYRRLAELSGISLGMVSKAFDYLEKLNYYRKSSNGRRLMNENELQIQWICSYAHALKPKLAQLSLDQPDSWDRLSFAEREHPGGELMAEKLSSGYLLPTTGIIYTPHSLLQRRQELNLKPARNGSFRLISCFWGSYKLNTRAKAMLCLADLLGSGDSRNKEVAGIINDRYLHLNESSLFGY